MNSKIKRTYSFSFSALIDSVKNESYYISMLILFAAGLIPGSHLHNWKHSYELFSVLNDTINKPLNVSDKIIISIILTLSFCAIIYNTGLSYSGKTLLYFIIPFFGFIIGSTSVKIIEGQPFLKGLSSIIPVALLEAVILCCYFILINYAFLMSAEIKKLLKEKGRGVPDIKDYNIRTLILLIIISIITFVVLLIR